MDESKIHLRPKFSDQLAQLTEGQIEGIYIMKYVDFLKYERVGKSLALGIILELFAEAAGFDPERKKFLQERAAVLAASGHF